MLPKAYAYKAPCSQRLILQSAMLPKTQPPKVPYSQILMLHNPFLLKSHAPQINIILKLAMVKEQIKVVFHFHYQYGTAYLTDTVSAKTTISYRFIRI